MVPAGPEVIEHPPTSSVDVVEDERDMYYDPPGLDIPFYVERVSQYVHVTIACLPPFVCTCTCTYNSGLIHHLYSFTPPLFLLNEFS